MPETGGGNIPPTKKATLESNARLHERQASLFRQLAEICDALAGNALAEAETGGGNIPPGPK